MCADKHTNMRPGIRAHGTFRAGAPRRLFRFRFFVRHSTAPYMIETKEKGHTHTTPLSDVFVDFYVSIQNETYFRFSGAFNFFLVLLFVVRSIGETCLYHCRVHSFEWKTHVRPCNRVSKQTEWQNKHKTTNKEPNAGEETKWKLRKKQIASRHTHNTHKNKYK